MKHKNKMSFPCRLMWVPFCAVFLLGCDPLSTADHRLIENHDNIVKRALTEDVMMQSFVRHFKNSKHFISYITGKEGRTAWNSKAGLFQRYVVEMKYFIVIDPITLSIKATDKPVVEILEIENIRRLADGRSEISYAETFNIPADVWLKFLQGDSDDLNLLGIEFKTNSPIDGFSEVLP